MEVVSDSPADRQRDYEQELIDYAAAKVAEYWIVDRERQVVIVHGPVGGGYSVLGEYVRAQIAASRLLEGLVLASPTRHSGQESPLSLRERGRG
jgi:Uma2 family endonuclease